MSYFIVKQSSARLHIEKTMTEGLILSIASETEPILLATGYFEK